MEKDEEKTNDSAYHYGSRLMWQLHKGETHMKLSGNDLDGAIEELIEQMRHTSTYQNYAKQKETVKNFPELKEKIDTLRELNYRLQKMPESEGLYEEGERLEQEYEELCEDTRVHDFMQAELDFCRLFQDILAKITSSIEFE